MSVTALHRLYKKGVPLVAMTAFDFTSGLFCRKAGVDIVLVGDSLGMTCLGYTDTTRVGMDEMVHHCKAVTRGCLSLDWKTQAAYASGSIKAAKSTASAEPVPLIVGDLPFGSYHESEAQGIQNAIRLIREGQCHAVKMEGIDGFQVDLMSRLISHVGIPVMAHLGLQPQHKNALGGYTVQARSANAAAKLLSDAKKAQEVGCFALVLEAIPSKLASFITSQLCIPTIGIGAGNGTSGQILVQHDMLGYFESSPKFVKRYAEFGRDAVDALNQYAKQVRSREFPSAEFEYRQMDDDEWKEFLESSSKA